MLLWFQSMFWCRQGRWYSFSVWFMGYFYLFFSGVVWVVVFLGGLLLGMSCCILRVQFLRIQVVIVVGLLIRWVQLRFLFSCLFKVFLVFFLLFLFQQGLCLLCRLFFSQRLRVLGLVLNFIVLCLVIGVFSFVGLRKGVSCFWVIVCRMGCFEFRIWIRVVKGYIFVRFMDFGGRFRLVFSWLFKFCFWCLLIFGCLCRLWWLVMLWSLNVQYWVILSFR